MRRRKAERVRLRREGHELFERGRNGQPTDARIWDAMLGDDDRDLYDGLDPEALTRRRRARGERLEEPETSERRDHTDTPYVLFLRTTSHGQRAAGRAVLKGDRVVFEGVEPALVEEMEHGIRVGRRTFTPADGDRFLRALPVQYSGSYLRAAYRCRRSTGGRRHA